MQVKLVDERLGLNVPYEWWPGAPLLKEIEAAGFSWVQVPTPPASVLANPRQCARHAAGVAESLAVTELDAIVHAPTGLTAGDEQGDQVLAGALSYAAELGADFLVYHAANLPDAPASEDRLLAETRSLAHAARIAERLDVTIAIENLAPTYPGPETLSASPPTLRSIVKRIGSERLSICLDLGHAHVIADQRHCSLVDLVKPVLGEIALFHLHDNLGARRGVAEAAGIDPLRLDLHLPPGRGDLPWVEVAPMLARSAAPLLCEVHPSHRPAPADLFEEALAALAMPQAGPAPDARRPRTLETAR